MELGGLGGVGGGPSALAEGIFPLETEPRFRLNKTSQADLGLSGCSDTPPRRLAVIPLSNCGRVALERAFMELHRDTSTFRIHEPQEGRSVLPLTGRSVPTSAHPHAANTHRRIKLTCRDTETKRQGSELRAAVDQRRLHDSAFHSQMCSGFQERFFQSYWLRLAPVLFHSKWQITPNGI